MLAPEGGTTTIKCRCERWISTDRGIELGDGPVEIAGAKCRPAPLPPCDRKPSRRQCTGRAAFGGRLAPVRLIAGVRVLVRRHVSSKCADGNEDGERNGKAAHASFVMEA